VNRAVLRRAFRDTRALLLALTLVVLGFEVLFVFVIGELSGQLIAFWKQMPFVSKVLRALVGIDPGRDVSFASMVAIGLIHPFLLAVLWTFLLVVCSRDTVGEIDRGTADLLLTLPVSRAAVYTSTTVVWIGAVAVLALATWAGIWIGGRAFDSPEPVDAGRYLRPLISLVALSAAIGCATMCASSFLVRRGYAIAVVLAALLLSFLLNFLAAFVPLLQPLCVLGVLYYYRPVDIVRDNAIPWRDVTVLLSSGAALWTIGLWRFCRRDIPAA
jgi:ABC-type transport system involved in multi-copper enzyme maturation permease subunit